MNDTLRDAGCALLGLALLTGLMRGRMEHAAVRTVRQSVQGGTLRAEMRAPLFEELSGSVKALRLTGSGLSMDQMPFRANPGGGPIGTIRHVEFDLRDVTVRGLAVRRFQASIPRVRVAVWDAVTAGQVRIREARPGAARVEVGAEALAAFAARKFPSLGDVRVTLEEGSATLAGNAGLFGPATPVEASGTLAVRDGRYLTFTPVRVWVNREPLPPEVAGLLLGALNPVLDIEQDLGIVGWATLTRVELTGGALVLHADVAVPRAEEGAGGGR